MARTVAELPRGTRITDYISLGMLATTLPLSKVQAVLAAQRKTSRRQRELPAHVVVYYLNYAQIWPDLRRKPEFRAPSVPRSGIGGIRPTASWCG